MYPVGPPRCKIGRGPLPTGIRRAMAPTTLLQQRREDLMRGRALDQTFDRMGLPPVPPVVQRVVAVLFLVYVLELASPLIGIPWGRWFAWQPLHAGFQPWQPVTTFFVQGTSAGDVFWVILSLVLLAMFAPTITRGMSRSELGEVLGASILVGTVSGLLIDLLGYGTGATAGWRLLFGPLFCLFGLRNPRAQVLLFFIVPVEARWFVTGAVAIASLSALSALGGGGSTLWAFHELGLILGVLAWWYLRGPGRRRRVLANQGARVEHAARRFVVHQGGRDDTVH